MWITVTEKPLENRAGKIRTSRLNLEKITRYRWDERDEVTLVWYGEGYPLRIEEKLEIGDDFR
jgi:hypothetical protein